MSLAQETFDAAVQENIDEFGMEPDEAVKSAVEEFQMQVRNSGLMTDLRKCTGNSNSSSITFVWCFHRAWISLALSKLCREPIVRGIACQLSVELQHLQLWAGC